MTEQKASDEERPAPTAQVSVPAALRQWRDAEKAVAVARRGKLAAEVAATAAAEAARAAQATADAAKRAVEAATLAEASAAQTATAARLAAISLQAELDDATTDVSLSEADEGLARHFYGESVEAARQRIGDESR